MTTPLRRLAAALLVLVVLLVASVETPLASLRIAWRFMVLSFDSPATQVMDDLVCESSPPSQAGAEAGHWTRLAALSSARIVPVAAPLRAVAPSLSSSGTRAPPVA